MDLYTLEIKGRPLLVFDADNQAEVGELLQSDGLISCLLRMTHDGIPIWDGKTERLIRGAKPKEIRAWKARKAELPEKRDDMHYMAFLIQVVDPAIDAMFAGPGSDLRKST